MKDQDFVFLSELERYDAFLTLFRSQEPQDIESLAALYRSQDPVVPLILLHYLAEIPEKEAIEPILLLLASDNQVVARAAARAYQLNHHPTKARQLNALVLSRNDFACRFAIRTLSRAGFMDCLPLILRDLPDRGGAVLKEMLDAVRYLPDRRSLPVLTPLCASPHEPTRYRAVLALTEIQRRYTALPAEFFLAKTRDDSERVRRAALDVLQTYPKRNVAELFLAQALDRAEPESTRERAVRSLSIFPSPLWVPPLCKLYTDEDSAQIRLAVEIALRSFPAAALRKGLLPLIEGDDASARRDAALLAAQFLPDDPLVREAVIALWRKSSDMEALDLAEALRELGGKEARGLLIEAVTRSPLLAAAAANALGRMRLGDDAQTILALLSYPKTSTSAKHAFLSHWARHGIDENLRRELLPWLISNLEDSVVNTRYLSLETLVWYPLSDKLPAILGLLTRETITDTVRSATTQIVKGLGRDPRPLLRALREHPGRAMLVGHSVRILTGQSWDPRSVPEVLDILRRPPLELFAASPETFLTVCIHFLRDSSLSFESLWEMLDTPERRLLFMRMLASFLAGAGRTIPPLPVAMLASHLAGGGPEERTLLYEVLSRDSHPDAIEQLAVLLLREKDPACAAAGRAALNRLLAGGVR